MSKKAPGDYESLRAENQRLRKDLSDALESAARWVQFAEATFEGIMLHDGQTIKDVNPQFAELFGYRREYVLGRSIWDFIDSDDIERVRSILATDSTEPYDIVAIRKDGERIPVTIRPRLYTDGRRIATFRIRRLKKIH